VPAVFLTGYGFVSGFTTWSDLSPNGRHATLEGGTSIKVGNAMQLNGSTSWTFPDVNTPTSWTVVVWAKISALNGLACVLTQKGDGTGATALDIMVGTGNNNTGIGFYTPNGGGYYNTFTPINIANNTWTCFTGVFNGSTIVSYVNGTSVGTSTPTYLPPSTSTGYVYRIGRRWDSAQYVTGYVGEIRVYAEPFNSTQVLADYNYVSAVRPYT
jgi:hypothetical protein